MTFKILQPVSSAPVSVQHLKRHLMLWNDDSYDAELGSLLLTATEYVSNHIGRHISPIQVGKNFPNFGDVTLDHKNPNNITVRYYDASDELQVLDAAGYSIDPTDDEARLTFSQKPALSKLYKHPVTIRYSTGMDFVPPVVRHAILMTAAELFEVRSESTDAQARVAQITIGRLLMTDKRVEV
ncbi:MAG: hypothetical protein II336_15310 [Loktanella sp.]|nr:hypothetical protein [Loktanella sp.]